MKKNINIIPQGSESYNTRLVYPLAPNNQIDLYIIYELLSDAQSIL